MAKRRGVRLFCIATGIAGMAALVATASGPSGPWRHFGLFLIFCCALGVLHVVPVKVTHADDNEELTLDEAFIVPMVLLLTPLEVVAGLGLATALGQLYVRASGQKAVFNVGQTLVSAAAAAAAYQLVRGSALVGSPRSVEGAVAGSLAYATISSLSVAAIIAVVQGRSFLRTVTEGSLLRATTWVGALCFGVLIFLAAFRYPWSPVLSLAPIVALQLGYVGAVEQRRQRRRMESLYRAAGEVRSAVDVDEVRVRLVTAAKRLLEASTVRLSTPQESRRPGSLVAEVENGVLLELGHPLGRRPWAPRDQQLLNTLAEVGASALEKARLFGEVKRQALYDPLTRLPNQILFEDRVTQALARAGRSGSRLAVLFIDLDNFKRVNDSLGHAMGNVLLERASQRISGVTRASDTLARMSGDEFTLLMPSISSVDDACAVGDKITAAFREPFRLAGSQIFCGASVGVAIYPDHGTHYGTLMQKADLAMYEAKGHGRGTYRIYSEAMSAFTQARLAMEAELRAALDRDELRVDYQPQVDLDSGTVVGVEALVRWQHPTRGLLGPDQFIPLAEDTGLVGMVDRWVLQRVCDQVRAWRAAGLPELRVAVNLSGAELGAQDLTRMVLKTAHDGDLLLSQLEIEVTESVAVREGAGSRDVLEELRGHGIRLAIDDFGTGYSTLARLGTFPIDTLKIDKSFIEAICTGVDEAPLVVAIIAMAHSLHLGVVAEGVENTEQLAFLREHGCDRAQGFLLSRPLPGESLEHFVLENLGSSTWGTEPRPLVLDRL